METSNATQENRVKKEVTVQPILVSKVYKGDYQKPGTQTAELKQIVVTKSTYPAKSVTSNLQDNIFNIEDFGFEKGQEYESTETRVAWIDVPEKLKLAEVEARLAALPEARLYRIMGNHPIISDNQVYGITEGLTTKDVIADRQAVRYPLGHEKEGQLIMDTNGKVQYKGIYFSSKGQPDIEKRTADLADVYLTPTIAQELSVDSTVSQGGIN